MHHTLNGNVTRIRLLFNDHAVGASKLLRINVFSATLLHDLIVALKTLNTLIFGNIALNTLS